MAGKPSKAKSEELVKDYLKAVNDDDADEFAKLIDVKGYIIFNEENILLRENNIPVCVFPETAVNVLKA